MCIPHRLLLMICEDNLSDAFMHTLIIEKRASINIFRVAIHRGTEIIIKKMHS